MDSANVRTPEAGSLGASLEYLEKRIDDVRKGRIDLEVKLDYSVDHPVGALAQAIKDMLEELRAARDAREVQEHELEVRIRTIREQQAAIMELSTPVIEVWKGVLTLPIVGTVDAERATSMTAGLLEAVVRVSAELAIIDVTGMSGVGADVCDHILRMARCVRLLGAECNISGMRPEVARTIVETGSEIGELRSYPTLHAALKYHVRGARGRLPVKARNGAR
jgi:rsbT co-antagonist protein RsbR